MQDPEAHPPAPTNAKTPRSHAVCWALACVMPGVAAMAAWLWIRTGVGSSCTGHTLDYFVYLGLLLLGPAAILAEAWLTPTSRVTVTWASVLSVILAMPPLMAAVLLTVGGDC